MEPGTVVAGRYRIVRHLGSGAMASVHLAEDQVLGRHVAIKSVHAGAGPDYGRRVQREARLGARHGHPNLVTVYDILIRSDSVLLVMEYVAGETLADALAAGAMEPARALEILRPLAEALDHVHAGGIVHRDVKPANILLAESGAVKLADLGVASSGDSTRITRTGGLMGTAAYMAPEQFDPGPVTSAADIHSLATVAFEMLTGKRPYPGANLYEVMAAVRDGDPPDARKARPGLPVAAADALRRGMARRPEDRPGSAGALVRALDAAFRLAVAPAATGAGEHDAAAKPKPKRKPKPAPAPRGSGAEPSRSRRSAAIAALAGAVVVAVLAVVLASGSGDDPADEQAAGSSTTAAPGTTSPASTASPTATATAAADARPTTPAGAVQAFYERAADGDLDGAWALAGPGLRAQLGPRSTFDGTFRTLRSIRFDRLDPTDERDASAGVRIATVATHTDHTDRCTGTVATTRAESGRWRLERIGVDCGAG